MSSNTPVDRPSENTASRAVEHVDINPTAVALVEEGRTLDERLVAFETALLVVARSLGQLEARKEIKLAKRRGCANLHGLRVLAVLILEGFVIAAVTYYVLALTQGG